MSTDPNGGYGWQPPPTDPGTPPTGPVQPGPQPAIAAASPDFLAGYAACMADLSDLKESLSPAGTDEETWEQIDIHLRESYKQRA